MENNTNKPTVQDEAKKLVLDNAAIEANLLRPGRSWFYQLAVNVLSAICKLLFFMRVEGRENIPEGACIIMGNHRAWIDPFCLAMCARDREIRFMGKKELWGNKAFAWIAKQVRGVPVDRGNVDMASIRMSMTVLKGGHTLGIFPEGTRTRGDGMMPIQGGVSLLALRSRCAVVPVYIDGDYRLFRPVVLRVGKPVQMDDLLAGRINKDSCDVFTERIKASFAELSGGRSLLAPVQSKKDEAKE